MPATLRQDVIHLAETIGERNLLRRPEALARTADWLVSCFEAAGYRTARLPYDVGGQRVENLEIELPGTTHPDEILVVGAHYDSVYGTPGADDNASGVAVLLALARAFAGATPARTVRFVAFVNEEPPYFQTEAMGSLVYARACKARGDRVVGMISLETVGYYDPTPGSQQFPLPQLAQRFPDAGTFLALVGNAPSAAFLQDVATAFRAGTSFPVEAAPFPEGLPGVGWSDQWAFWQVGYPAVMATDTAPFRNPHYHQASDLPATLDFAALEAVTAGFVQVVRDLAC